MSTNLVNKSEVKNALKVKGLLGNTVASLAMWITGLNKINKIYKKAEDSEGIEFAENILKAINIKCAVSEEDLNKIPKEGAFILVSNHPYGSVDGLMMLNEIGRVRPDIKILTNFILSYIPNLSDNFFPVNPFTDSPGLRSSLKGLRLAKEHLANGGALGLFPAGEVSSTANKERVVKDIEWQESVIKLIKGANVPVVPLYFDGCNSKFFHIIGKIHPLLRTVRLPHEFFNKKNRSITLKIGNIIQPSEIEEYHNIKSLGKYLWNRSYALKANINEVSNNISNSEYTTPIAKPIDKEKLQSEIDSLSSKALFTVGNYSCYLFNHSDIPHLIVELARVREVTFRAVGEGTNLALDRDKYDSYYKHLILWDNKKSAIVGAYRLGIAEEIIPSRGIDGLYSNSLFNYSAETKEYLLKSIELGRSFVSLEYQKEALPLMLLIKGLMHSVLKYPKVKHFIGPVSFSTWYPHFYQSLMIYYLKERHSIKEYEPFIKPNLPFEPNYNLVNVSELLDGKCTSLEKFDRFMYKISSQRYKLPTLVKKYIRINAKIIAYNVDPDFNNCVDGLVIVNLNEIPKSEVDLLTKELTNKEEIYKRFDISAYGTGSYPLPPQG